MRFRRGRGKRRRVSGRQIFGRRNLDFGRWEKLAEFGELAFEDGNPDFVFAPAFQVVRRMWDACLFGFVLGDALFEEVDELRRSWNGPGDGNHLRIEIPAFDE